MMIDFETPMSIYELLALSISIIAIIIPIGRCLWNKWGKKAKLNYLPNGTVNLFFNQSGSYLRIDGAYEAVNKPISVKSIAVSVIRRKDDKKLNLSWSSFISPVNQSLVGNYIQTTEKAHPFRIEADSIACAFTEFADPFDSAGKVFERTIKDLFEQSRQPIIDGNYDDAVIKYCQMEKYIQAKSTLEKEFFWEIGKYDIMIYVQFSGKMVEFHYSMCIDESSHKKLYENIDESLVAPLKRIYGIAWSFQNANVEITEINQKYKNKNKSGG